MYVPETGHKHFSALVRVFLYLRATSDLSLSLGGLGPDTETISIATDASHEEGPSLTGVMVVMGAALIDWFSRRQKAAVRNSTAAEAVANADGSDHGVFIRELARDFDVHISPTPFYTDNESSIKLHSDYYACKKSKVIVRAIAALRHYVMTRIYVLFHIPGKTNPADFLTKPLAREPFIRFRDMIMGARVSFVGAACTTALWSLNSLYSYLTMP